VALIRRAFAQYRGRLQPESSALSEDAAKIGALIAQGGVVVATEGGRITGCVAIQRKPDCIYAGRLAVEPAARGKGTGRALMAAAENVARGMAGRLLRVDVRLALAENRAFFRSLGFVEGIHRCHPGFAEPTYVELEKILF
jgi:GNAT superfamily N-acetyltransferase